MTTATEPTTQSERVDLLQTLGKHRFFLRFTVRDLTDEQARLRSTVSALCLGGLIKHVTLGESAWAGFIADGPAALGGDADASSYEEHEAGFRMGEDETLAELLDAYAVMAARTDELVRTLPSLDADQPLPVAPWFESGARWSARRVLLHIIAETAQHAGHADILREAIDGSKTMG
jgi:hypothetical protein